MKCESCNIRSIEVDELCDNGRNSYHLCIECHNRLMNLALRPLEFFNLTAIHGHSFHLHDDFYDYDTGEATQPEIKVIDTDKFPFPDFEQIKNDLNRLIDFSFVQYFTEDFVVEQLQLFDKIDVLNRIDAKVKYNRAINYKAYEIVGKVVGKAGEKWLIEEWKNRTEDELQIFAEPIANCLDFEKAFGLITRELENRDDKFLSENFSALLYFQSNKTLDWIEKVSGRIKNVSTNWGQLAASSQFNWHTAEKWLSVGRPLSLVALDALIFCTTTGDRLNQSLWLRRVQPKLIDKPKPQLIEKRLREYLLFDHVPRTKNTIENIISNIFEPRT